MEKGKFEEGKGLGMIKKRKGAGEESGRVKEKEENYVDILISNQEKS